MGGEVAFAGRSLRIAGLSPIIITESTLDDSKSARIFIKRISMRILRRNRKSSFFLPKAGHERLVQWIESQRSGDLQDSEDFTCDPIIFLGILTALADKDPVLARCQQQLLRLAFLRRKLFPSVNAGSYKLDPETIEDLLVSLQALEISDEDVAETGLALQNTRFDVLQRMAGVSLQFCQLMRVFMSRELIIPALSEEFLIESAMFGAMRIDEIRQLQPEEGVIVEKESTHNPDILRKLAIYALFLCKKQETCPLPLQKILAAFAMWCLPSTQDGLEQNTLEEIENYEKFEPLLTTMAANRAATQQPHRQTMA